MSLLLNILIVWCLVSVPVSLLAARMIKTRGLMYTVPAPSESSKITVMKYHL
jgi:hypothetical protein